ncbi:hypothetical protein KDAU_24790 [Dictyobacter aurantiacus]|uniref:Uncharacterized protein n=1 Tax=Dictyobacter aurantiacus TaxID=1936993 RepID=A0A401ZE43_9CHLR|nr:hypothetical protein KDAU_24790 [Dictyobacter aurantiacus]
MAERTMSAPSLFLYAKSCVIDLVDQGTRTCGESARKGRTYGGRGVVGDEIYDILGSQPNAKGADVTCPER